MLGAAAAIVIVAVAVALTRGGNGGSASGAAAGGGGTGGATTSGSRPWALAAPETAGGLTRDHAAEASGAFDQYKPNLTAAQAHFGGAGHVARAIWAIYDLGPAPAGGVPPVVVFDGATGTFTSPQAVISKYVAAVPAGMFKSVPPGPHGGLAACAITSQGDVCVWATSTTTGSLTTSAGSGANLASVMLRMRGDLEQPAA